MARVKREDLEFGIVGNAKEAAVGEAGANKPNLAHGELLTALEIAPLPWAVNATYRKVRDRASYAFALVSVAAALEVRDGTVHQVRLALGGASHKPHRALKAEAALRGGPATAQAFLAAADAELADARPGQHNAYKLPMLRNTIAAVLSSLAQGGRP